MAHMKMDSQGDEVHVQLDVSSDGAVQTPFNSHLLKDALVSLIEDCPLDFWVKDDGELTPDEFLGAMLGAVARSHRTRSDVTIDENLGNAAVLRDLIDWLEREEYL